MARSGVKEEAIRLESPDESDRVFPDVDDKRVCYWFAQGVWWIYLPEAGAGRLTDHDVKEHEDGTITVSPSIGLQKGDGSWARHGFLERGVWREV